VSSENSSGILSFFSCSRKAENPINWNTASDERIVNSTMPIEIPLHVVFPVSVAIEKYYPQRQSLGTDLGSIS